MKNKKSFILVLLLTLTTCFSLFGCGPAPDKFNVTTKVWYAGFGSSYGSGTYEEQTDVTITASPKQGSEFIAWVKDDLVVSYSKDYTFKMSADTSGTYIALFTNPEKEVLTLKNVSLNTDYDADSISFTNLNVEFWIGSSFNNLQLAHKADVIELTKYEITDKIFALNAKNKIPVKVVLNYTITDVNEEEETEHVYTAETKFELDMDIKTPVLTTELLKLNTPLQVKGNVTAQLEFAFLEAKAVEPETPPAE